MPSLEKKIAASQTASHWKRIGLHDHKGINLPLSALLSKNSCGIGEFFDLLPLIDLCQELGLDIIQLLPLNDTARDPSPYNAISSCALHPIYLSIQKLPGFTDSSLMSKLPELQQLNTSEKVAFAEVQTKKMQLLFLYFKEQGHKILLSPSFNKFLEEHSWLKPYALFKSLSHELGHACFSTWPDEFKYPSKENLPVLISPREEEISFYLVLQYLCFKQLQEVKQIANAKGVFLKGDIPILISPNSADVWFYPEFFNTDLSIGAPPDTYCKEGQNWGFPGLHWADMKKSHFSWWKDRLSYATHFYDLYRIDHAVGLFRLWSIPLGKPSAHGQFVPANENLWGPQGKELLETLTSASIMLPIAEDLGTIPHMVRPLLLEMGIPGTRVMRWERRWETDHGFIDPHSYNRISLTCVSTHDSPTLEQWWRDFPEESMLYAKEKGWTYTPKLTQKQRQTILKESNRSSSFFHINLLPEYLALVPEFIATNPDEERINIPGVVLPTNWTYRFRKPVEEMVSSSILKEAIRSVL